MAKYSAGAIFLQVVPVFADVQKNIEREVEGIDRALSPRMQDIGERSGEKMGRSLSNKLKDEVNKGTSELERDLKRNVERMGGILDDLPFPRLSDDAKREVFEINKELAKIHDVEINTDVDATKAYAQIKAVEARLDALSRGNNIILNVETRKALAELERAKKAFKAAAPKVVAKFEVDDSNLTAFDRRFQKTVKSMRDSLGPRGLEGEVGRLMKEFEDLGKRGLSPQIFEREARRISQALKNVASREFSIDGKINLGSAAAEIDRLTQSMNRGDASARRFSSSLRQTGNTSRSTGRNFNRMGNDADTAANSFRSFNGILFGLVTIGPAAIPIIAALAGGLLAIGPAAAVAAFGLGAVIVGFTGIGDALTALGNRDKQAALTAQTSAKQQASAARSVADARRSAAKQIESALKRQADAQKRYRKSIDDVREAEQALRDAREAAKDTGKTLDRSIRENRLAIDQARIDAFNAATNLAATNADGSSTTVDKEQARIDNEQAQLNLENLRAEQERLAAEKKKWDKDGVNGTEEVKSAQERLLDAIDTQKEAYADLGEASKDVDEARREGARQVAEALRGQADALDQLNTQQNAVNQAFENLGPAGRRFSLFLYGLRDEFRSFRNDVQSVLLPAVEEAISGFMNSKSGKVARTALIALADAFGKFVVALSKSFQGPVWTQFFQMLADLGPQITQAYGQAFISIFEALASILTVLAPYALDFAEAFASMAEKFAEWAASKEGQQDIIRFMEFVKRIAPDVLDFIRAFAGFVATVAEGLADWGDTVMKGITNFLDFISGLDPKLVSALAVGFVVIASAAQTAFFVMNLFTVGLTVFASTAGIVIFALVALGAAFVYLFKTNKTFRDFVKKAWAEIAKAVQDAWKDLKPALMDFLDAVMELWKKVLAPFLAFVGVVVFKLIKFLLPTLMRFWAFAFRAMAFVIRNIIIPVIGFIAKRIRELYVIAKPLLQALGLVFKLVFKGMALAWKLILKPIFDKIIDGALPRLKKAFKETVERIGVLWDGFRTLLAAPVKFFIETIMNKGLIKGINKVIEFATGRRDAVDEIKLPKDFGKYATGGILPGYTPGRDVHTFYSPQMGRLHLSGGEAIMRPEWTAAVGPGFVNYMNQAARAGGIGGVRKAMSAMMGGAGAYAKGGIFWPLPGGTKSTYAGHDGVDLNAPNDLGKPFYSATSGRVTSTGYGRGYGNAVFVLSPYGELVYGHALDGSIRVRPGQTVAPGQMLAQVGSTGNSTGPHLHFGFPGGTYEQAVALLNGAATSGIKKFGDAKTVIAGALKKFLKSPLGYVKDLVAKPIDALKEKFGSSKYIETLVAVPGRLVKGVASKVLDIVPDSIKNTVGNIGKIAGTVTDKVGDAAGAVGDAIGLGGFANGGILPYNGTMMYDNGGYLPPGVTNVVNLTGKPEPVFTSKQFSNMGGRGTEAGSIHYEPHFEGSDLTAGEVMSDFAFTVRKMRRHGKYGG